MNALTCVLPVCVQTLQFSPNSACRYAQPEHEETDALRNAFKIGAESIAGPGSDPMESPTGDGQAEFPPCTPLHPLRETSASGFSKHLTKCWFRPTETEETLPGWSHHPDIQAHPIPSDHVHPAPLLGPLKPCTASAALASALIICVSLSLPISAFLATSMTFHLTTLGSLEQITLCVCDCVCLLYM